MLLRFAILLNKPCTVGIPRKSSFSLAPQLGSAHQKSKGAPFFWISSFSRLNASYELGVCFPSPKVVDNVNYSIWIWNLRSNPEPGQFWSGNTGLSQRHARPRCECYRQTECASIRWSSPASASVCRHKCVRRTIYVPL